MDSIKQYSGSAYDRISMLVIEDDEDDYYRLNMLLKKDTRREYSLTHCLDLSSACEELNRKNFDVVLLDLGLGITTGIDTLLQLKKFSFDVPVIILTGSNDEAMGEQAVIEGAADYIPKGEANTSLLSRTIVYTIERHHLIQTLRNQALTDSLTELPNRAALFQRMQEIIDSSERKHTTFAAVMLDLDDFKAVNDNFGHQAGDDLLKCVAKRLSAELRKTDIAARLAGDEFVLIYTHLRDKREIVDVVQAKIDKISVPVELTVDGTQQLLDICISAGIAIWEEGLTANKLLFRADNAMYASKIEGKRDNCSRVKLYRE